MTASPHLPAVARAVLFSLAVSACFSHSAVSQPVDPKREVETAIQGAIRLLEREQHVEFIKTYMRPSELERHLAKFGTIETVAAEFKRTDRASAILKTLQAAGKAEPTFSREGTIASYRFEPPIGKERSLSLQKIGDRWFLRD